MFDIMLTMICTTIYDVNSVIVLPFDKMLMALLKCNRNHVFIQTLVIYHTISYGSILIVVD